MFGIIRPCRHRLPGELYASWQAHLCGLCLALRDEHGQLARTVTNYDGLVISALVEAQSAAGGRRQAGPCPLRGMRSASVAEGAGARLAASVSLVLAAAKVTDHTADGDGIYGRRLPARAAGKVAARWAEQGARSGAKVGFDTAVLTTAVDRQQSVERSLHTGDDVLRATEPTEKATGAAFAHAAVVAGIPANAAPLRLAGRLFGRIAHLLDAVEDLDSDAAIGAWNPLAATGTSLAEADQLCRDARRGLRRALIAADFHDDRLVHALLVHELDHTVHRTFQGAGHHRTPDDDEGQESEDTDEADQQPPKRRKWGLAALCAGGGITGCCAGLWAAVSSCENSCNRAGNACGNACGDACNQTCGKACDQACQGCCDDCGDSCDCGECNCDCEDSNGCNC